jgi:hypothetical protein
MMKIKRDVIEYLHGLVCDDVDCEKLAESLMTRGPNPDGSWSMEIPGRFTKDGHPFPFTLHFDTFCYERCLRLC